MSTPKTPCTQLLTMIDKLEYAKTEHDKISEPNTFLSLHATTNKVGFIPIKDHVITHFPRDEINIIIGCLKKEYITLCS